MNSNLYAAGIIAIPLKEDTNFTSFGIQPNYLVIEAQNGKFKNIPFENPITKEVENKTCTRLTLSFQYRTIWTDNNQLQALIFPSRVSSELIPYEFIGLLIDHETLLVGKNMVNLILSLFSFENGNMLEGFVASLDEVVCQEIIDN
jgi:hypothetical protein